QVEPSILLDLKSQFDPLWIQSDADGCSRFSYEMVICRNRCLRRDDVAYFESATQCLYASFIPSEMQHETVHASEHSREILGRRAATIRIDSEAACQATRKHMPAQVARKRWAFCIKSAVCGVAVTPAGSQP